MQRARAWSVSKIDKMRGKAQRVSKLHVRVTSEVRTAFAGSQ
jgi:hypothetical protein